MDSKQRRIDKIEDKLDKIEGRVSDLEHRTTNIEANDRKVESHLLTLRDTQRHNEQLLVEVRNMVEKLDMTNQGQNKLIAQMQQDRTDDRAERKKYTFWLITTVGGMFITGLVSIFATFL